MWRSLFGRREGGSPPSRPASAAEQLLFVLNYGLLAPAVGVPWVMHVRGDAIDVVLHHQCHVPTRDAAHRDVIVACGAALAQLRLAVRQLGFNESTILVPEEGHPQLLARVYLEGAGPAAPEAYVLYQALRGPLLFAEDIASPAVDEALLVELEAVCLQERAQLHFVPESALLEGRYDPDNQTRYGAARVRSSPSFGPSAASCDAPTLDQMIPLLHPAQLREFNIDRAVWLSPTESLRSLASAIIATQGDEAVDWLAAGQALARVLLRARVDGIHATVRSLTSPEFRSQTAAMARPLRGLSPQLGLELGFPYARRLASGPSAPQLLSRTGEVLSG